MKTLTLGRSDLTTTRLAYGCMRITGTWDPSQITDDLRAKGREAVIAAYEAGYRLFDHADIYGAGECEKLFAEVLREVGGMRDEIVIATKCGVRFAGDPEPGAPARYDLSGEHILRSCERSLERLGIETIDLYQLHRPDLLLDPDDAAAAFEKLQQQGKVRHFGVSNFTPSQVAMLQSACSMPLVVNQVEIHLARLSPFEDGTLDQCLEQQMTPLAWSPLAGGALGAEKQLPADHPRAETVRRVAEALDRLAEEHGVTRPAVALAWLMTHPSRIVPIVGSTNPQHIRDAAAADDVELTREQWYQVLLAARGKGLP